jgi:hypothetical protein
MGFGLVVPFMQQKQVLVGTGAAWASWLLGIFACVVALYSLFILQAKPAHDAE